MDARTKNFRYCYVVRRTNVNYDKIISKKMCSDRVNLSDCDKLILFRFLLDYFATITRRTIHSLLLHRHITPFVNAVNFLFFPKTPYTRNARQTVGCRREYIILMTLSVRQKPPTNYRYIIGFEHLNRATVNANVYTHTQCSHRPQIQ